MGFLNLQLLDGLKNKVFSSLLKQNFHAPDQNLIWCTDFTYMRLSNGKIRYTCSIPHLYDQSIVVCGLLQRKRNPTKYE